MNCSNVIKQPTNPTNKQRYDLLATALKQSGRLEDLNNIVSLLNPPKDISNYATIGKYKNTKIGIIGGGVAGMAAAFELRKLGCDITIYEALEDRIGGRIYTYYFDKSKELYGELGALRIPISHESTWHYINLFNLNTIPFIQSNPQSLIYVNRTRARNTPTQIQNKIYPTYNLTEKEKNTPWNELSDYAINYYLNNLTPAIRTQILKILPCYNKKYSKLINYSTNQNFESLGLSRDAIDMITSIQSFTGSVLSISFNETLQETYPEAFTYMYNIKGGNVNLPLAFYKSLTSSCPKEYKGIPTSKLGKIHWKGGNWVTGIYESPKNNKVFLQYQNNKSSDFAMESFDYVVCAIPFTTLSTVDINPYFSNIKMQAIRDINYIDGQRTLLLCNKRFWEENKPYGKITGGVSNTDLAITNVIYPSDHYFTGPNPNTPGVLIGSYSLNKFGENLGNIKPNLHIPLVKKQVEEVHGLPQNYLDNIVTNSKFIDWNKEVWFRGASSYFSIEQKRLFSLGIIKPEYNNKVFFAGEHASTTHGWIQGSLYTAKLAANNIAKVITCENKQ